MVLSGTSMQRGMNLLSILVASVICLDLSVQEEDMLEHINVKCPLCRSDCILI